MTRFNVSSTGDSGRFVDWVFGKNGALFRAAAVGRLDLVQELLEDGANVNMTSGQGYTPLHRAAENGHADIVEYLLEQGADADAHSREDTTPLALADKNGHAEIAGLLRDR